MGESSEYWRIRHNDQLHRVEEAEGELLALVRNLLNFAESGEDFRYPPGMIGYLCTIERRLHRAALSGERNVGG